MLLETVLAYLHLLALLAAVVFLSSLTALCRAAWLNPAALQRLLRLDTLYWICMAAVLASGLARMAWGMKGWAWYASRPMLHLKWAVLALMLALSWRASRQLRLWWRAHQAGAGLPNAQALDATRRQLMWAAHGFVLLPAAAVALARGY